MASIFPPPPTTPVNPNLYAVIDMGTNSFKMLIARTDSSTGTFLAVDRLKQQVLLGQSKSVTESKPSFSHQVQIRAISTLQKFTQYLKAHNITCFRFVATSAVREAENQKQFLNNVREDLGIEVEVLSGEEEAMYVYFGVLQFLPCFDKLVLCVDIGGGSTEFAIGKHGKLKFAKSLKLGHVTLTENFLMNGDIESMRAHIRRVFNESGVIEEVRSLGFEVVVGSSGTIRAIEKAIFHGYAGKLVNSSLLLGEIKREWKFKKDELSDVVEKLCGEENRFRRDEFFKKRSEFIYAGAVLLEEIFEVLGIEEMEVSGFALGEGLITERLSMVCEDYDFNANLRWQSVVRLATRFNSEKKMRCAAQYAYIAKELFQGIRKSKEFVVDQNEMAVSLHEKDLEYIEAACLLHSIGVDQSSKTIINGGYLYGYSDEEVKLIALLARHHYKKFPILDLAYPEEFPQEVKQKFRLLSPILRIAVFIQKYHGLRIEDNVELSHDQDGFKLALGGVKDQPKVTIKPFGEGFENGLEKELELFTTVFMQKLSIVVHSSI